MSLRVGTETEDLPTSGSTGSAAINSSRGESGDIVRVPGRDGAGEHPSSAGMSGRLQAASAGYSVTHEDDKTTADDDDDDALLDGTEGDDRLLLADAPPAGILGGSEALALDSTFEQSLSSP